MDAVVQLLGSIITGAATIVAAYITVAHVNKKDRQSRERDQAARFDAGDTVGASRSTGLPDTTQRSRHETARQADAGGFSSAAWHPRMAAVIIVAGWAVGGAIAMPLAIIMRFAGLGTLLGGALGWAAGTAFAGFVMIQGVRLLGRSPTGVQSLVLVVGWAAAGAIGGGLSWEQSSIVGGAIGGAVAGTIGGLIAGRVLQDMGLPLSSDQLVVTAGGWALAAAAGGVLSWAFFGFMDLAAYVVAGAVTGAVIGLIGSSVMLFELDRLRRERSMRSV